MKRILFKQMKMTDSTNISEIPCIKQVVAVEI